jgi:hypothetical protein
MATAFRRSVAAPPRRRQHGMVLGAAAGFGLPAFDRRRYAFNAARFGGFRWRVDAAAEDR